MKSKWLKKADLQPLRIDERSLGWSALGAGLGLSLGVFIIVVVVVVVAVVVVWVATHTPRG